MAVRRPIAPGWMRSRCQGARLVTRARKQFDRHRYNAATATSQPNASRPASPHSNASSARSAARPWPTAAARTAAARPSTGRFARPHGPACPASVERCVGKPPCHRTELESARRSIEIRRFSTDRTDSLRTILLLRRRQMPDVTWPFPLVGQVTIAGRALLSYRAPEGGRKRRKSIAWSAVLDPCVK